KSGAGFRGGKLSRGTRGSSTGPPVNIWGAFSLALHSATIWAAAVSKKDVSAVGCKARDSACAGFLAVRFLAGGLAVARFLRLCARFIDKAPESTWVRVIALKQTSGQLLTERQGRGHRTALTVRGSLTRSTHTRPLKRALYHSRKTTFDAHISYNDETLTCCK